MNKNNATKKQNTNVIAFVNGIFLYLIAYFD